MQSGAGYNKLTQRVLVMRFEVPQFIEIEDKIFGPFTFKQFIYLGGGVGIATVLFLTTNFIIFLIFGLPVGALGILFAFYKVNNRPFSHFLESMLQYFSKNRLYIWTKKGSGIYKDQPIDGEVDISQTYTPQNKAGNLHSLSRKLELQAMQKKQ